MNIELPDSWGSEPVSEFLHFAYLNNVKFLTDHSGMPSVKAIRETDDLYVQFTRIKFQMAKHHVLPNFITRSRSSFLGAIRLATSGETVESYMVSRGCLENALYALHIYEDKEFVYINDGKTITKDQESNGSQRVQKRFKTWLKRNASPEANKECRKVFSNSNVKKTLLEKNGVLGNAVSALYDRTINYGAHPNFGGIAATCQIELEGSEDGFLLPPDNTAFKLGVQTVVEIGVCCLFIFYWIFEEHVSSETRTRLNNLVGLFPRNLQEFSL